MATLPALVSESKTGSIDSVLRIEWKFGSFILLFVILQPQIESGDKIIMHPSALDRLGYFGKGNKPAKQETDDVILLKVVPPLDRAYMKWLARDVAT
ncbi:hypothetical protein K1719_003467 [Acacia pycnantha]|nr:hypothetical protein K1719_003467 [Acacia pycnantha]